MVENWKSGGNTGEQMKGALAEALRTGDFRELNNLVSQTVTNALNEAGKYISVNGDEKRYEGPYQGQPWQQPNSGRQSRQGQQGRMGQDFGQQSRQGQQGRMGQDFGQQSRQGQQGREGTQGWKNPGQEMQDGQSQEEMNGFAQQDRTDQAARQQTGGVKLGKEQASRYQHQGEHTAQQSASQGKQAWQAQAAQRPQGEHAAQESVSHGKQAWQAQTAQQQSRGQYARQAPRPESQGAQQNASQGMQAWQAQTARQPQGEHTVQQNTFQNRQAWQAQTAQRPQEELAPRQVQPPVRRGANLSLVKMKRVGSVSGLLYQVSGGIGFGVTALVAFVRMISFFNYDTYAYGWFVNLFFFLFFFWMLRFGTGKRKRIKRAERYVQLCDYRMFGQVEDLARGTGRSVQYVEKDITKMLQLGMFPEGHLDSQNTCFMLNDVVYRQYLKAEESRRMREEEDRRLEDRGAGEAPEAASGDGQQENELNTMVAEGMECIRKLKELNGRISGEAISAKLSKLENLLREIFVSVREHPEQMHRMHKLMDYYLPTTIKLVESYEEFGRVSTPGEEILEAMSEIENTLDTINQAFTELLNNLFQDAAFDATTDAQVLKSMLAREGLTNEMEAMEDAEDIFMANDK